MGYIPFRTVWGCVLLALVLGLLCLIAPAAASALFSLAVAGNNVAWGVPIFCRLVWGGDKFKPGPFYTGALSKPIGWVAIMFLVFGIVLSMVPVGGPNPTAETMNYTVVINCAVWLGSLLYYFVDARKWFTGPKITLSEESISEAQVEAIKADGLDIEGVPAEENKRSTEAVGLDAEKKV
jgi:hypothetical protein